jgi:hypothetical protein
MSQARMGVGNAVTLGRPERDCRRCNCKHSLRLTSSSLPWADHCQRWHALTNVHVPIKTYDHFDSHSEFESMLNELCTHWALLSHQSLHGVFIMISSSISFHLFLRSPLPPYPLFATSSSHQLRSVVCCFLCLCLQSFGAISRLLQCRRLSSSFFTFLPHCS